MTSRSKMVRRAAVRGLLALVLVTAVACGDGEGGGVASTTSAAAETATPADSTGGGGNAPTVSPGVGETRADPATPEATTAAPATPGTPPTTTSRATPTAEPTPTVTAQPTLAAGEVLLVISDGAGSTATIRAEVAETRAERSQGLMGRTELGADAGMLFLFGRTVHSPFWMKNTYVPLDIAFLAEDGTVQEILEGTPESEELLQPALPYVYVVEVNHGWFEQHGLGTGATVTIPDEVKGGGTP